MAKRLPARIILPIAEPPSPKQRQLAAVRARFSGSEAYLNTVAELAYGIGWADRACMMEAR